MPRPESPTTSPADSGKSAEPSTTDFAITCVCGEAHSGNRRRRHQQILCKNCGAALFVLPLDTYPAPTTLTKKRGRKKKGGAVATKAIGDAFAKFGQQAGQKITAAATSSSNFLKWIFSPVKLAVYGVLTFVVLTTWYVAHQKALTRAETDIVTAADAGYAALQDGEYESAHEHFRVAADAARLLDRTDEPSRRLIQAERETAALATLATTSIFELVEDVDNAGVDGDGNWKGSQRVVFEDQWIAFDAIVERRGDRVAVAMPVGIGNPPRDVYIRVDSPAFETVPLSEPTTVTFAGQIENVRQTPTAWDIVLAPETIFLWETPGLYAALGFGLDPVWNTKAAVEARLERQREWQGGEALPEDDAPIETATESDE